VPRPFNPRELAARVKAILRRTATNCSLRASGCLRHPGLCLDARCGKVQVEGQKVHLTPREFDLLWQLARSPNRVFTREELLDAVWHDEGDHYLHTVDSTIDRLRQKLRPLILQTWQIRTVRGRGYQFKLEQ
jgi:two-component system response regulator ResD